jgi:hypothetical protein
VLSSRSDTVAVGAQQPALGDFSLNGDQRPATDEGACDTKLLGRWVDMIKIHAFRRKATATVTAWASLQIVKPSISLGYNNLSALAMVRLEIGLCLFWIFLCIGRVACDDAHFALTPSLVKISVGFLHVALLTALHMEIY